MKSVWQLDAAIAAFPRLREDISADVLVIGGGLAGLLTAYCLKETGIDVVLVEKDRLCGATTAHTTAKITAQHGLCYHKIIRSYGEDAAKLYYRANTEAVERLKELCRAAGCPMEEKTNFVYSTNRRKLEAELYAMQKLGIGAVLDGAPPLPIPTAGAVGIPGQAQFHPLKLAGFLAEGLRIYEQTKVEELIGTTAVTEYGRIRAKKIVVATHFPFLNKHGSYFLKLYQHRSYLLGLENGPKFDGMYVDDDQKGMSFSSFGGWTLLGGGGHRTGKQGGCYAELRSFAKEHWPDAVEQLHWAAQDTISLDGIPYIGRYSPNTPNLYVAAGFNKWGMTGSMVSGMLLSRLIAGEEPEYAGVFSPSRSILKPQLLVNGFETAANFLVPTTKRCPHLVCALKYNKVEHSWDCGCHSSRFSESGKVLDNPANGDLN